MTFVTVIIIHAVTLLMLFPPHTHNKRSWLKGTVCAQRQSAAQTHSFRGAFCTRQRKEPDFKI